MKKFILAAIAATLAIGPVAVSAAEAAPAQTRHSTTVRERNDGRTVVRTRTVTRHDDRRGGPRNDHRNWRTGDRFDRRQAVSYRRLDDWRAQRLAAPRRGQYWARSGRDAVLVRDNGTIVSVKTRVFR